MQLQNMPQSLDLQIKQILRFRKELLKATVLIVSMQTGMIRIATVEYIAVVLTADIIIRAIEMVVSIINKKMMLHSGVVKPHNN